MNFNWLHFTDLHFGMTGQRHLWPNIRAAFLEDLRNLHDKCGPWHVVFFTGDFVQSGCAEEFQGLNEILKQLWEEFARFGSNPSLIPVPGNHDLMRPNPRSPATMLLSKWDDFPDIQEEFWSDPNCEYRKTVSSAFANYSTWMADQEFSRNLSLNTGLLPGDVSVSIQHNNVKIGVIGLNTTFLQLTGGDYKGRLAWDPRQFHGACAGDGVEWVKKHQICILLTHQGPNWLNAHSRTRVYPEINPAGRFAVHLFGHMHESVIRTGSFGGGPFLRTWQGNSLFGLEHYGDEKTLERRHGYAGGSIIFEDDATFIRHWPRETRLHGANGWVVIPDYSTAMLQDDQGTNAEPVKVRDYVAKRPEKARPVSQANSALAVWQKKLEFLVHEEAKAADPAQRFVLRKMIEEAKERLYQIGGG